MQALQFGIFDNVQGFLHTRLPKGTVQVSDCNIDPTPAEILLFTNQKTLLLIVHAGITIDIPNEQPPLD